MINKRRWGYRIFSFALVLIALSFWLIACHSDLFCSLRMHYCAGVVLSIVVMITGHLSYSRVHNSKIYLIGYLGGLCGCGFFLPRCAESLKISLHIPDGYFGAVMLLICANLIITLLMKSFVKYQLARSITLALFFIELLLIDIALLSPHATSWVEYLAFESAADLKFWLMPFLSAAIIAASIVFMKNEFHIGGIIAGIAFVNGTIWTYGVNNPAPESIQVVLMLAMELFTVVGIMFHWLSRIEHRVVIDPLLQIYNREYCSKIISEQAPMNLAPPLTVVMVDIDHFKNVNDTYGHKAGDDVLYAVAQAVNRGVEPHGIACRYGGEELAVFFPGLHVKNVMEIMERLRVAVEKIVTVSGKKKISVTISGGVAERVDISQSIEMVLSAADKALYRAKKGGRNQVRSGKV